MGVDPYLLNFSRQILESARANKIYASDAESVSEEMFSEHIRISEAS